MSPQFLFVYTVVVAFSGGVGALIQADRETPIASIATLVWLAIVYGVGATLL